MPRRPGGTVIGYEYVSAPVCVDTETSPSRISFAFGGSAPMTGAGTAVMSPGAAHRGDATAKAANSASARVRGDTDLPLILLDLAMARLQRGSESSSSR